MKWLSTVKHAEAGRLQIERMELDTHGFKQPTGEFDLKFSMELCRSTP